MSCVNDFYNTTDWVFMSKDPEVTGCPKDQTQPPCPIKDVTFPVGSCKLYCGQDDITSYGCPSIVCTDAEKDLQVHFNNFAQSNTKCDPPRISGCWANWITDPDYETWILSQVNKNGEPPMLKVPLSTSPQNWMLWSSQGWPQDSSMQPYSCLK